MINDEVIEEVLLFSIREYIKTVNFVLSNNCWWQECLSRYYQGIAAYVINYKATYYAVIVNYERDIYFSPALSILSIGYTSLKSGKRLVKYNLQWNIINDDLFIAEIPVNRGKLDEYKTKGDAGKYLTKRINKIRGKHND